MQPKNLTHPSLEVTLDNLDSAKTQVIIGATYRHYKDSDSRYQVTGLGVLEATDEVCVFYVSALEPKITFVRPFVSWLESIKINGVSKKRFEPILDPSKPA